MVELRILGPLQLSASDGRDLEGLARQAKRLALLAYLAAAVPRGLHRRDKLLALFWPELDQSRARAALSQALYVLRTTLRDQAIVTRGDDEVGINPLAVWTDVVALEAALDARQYAEGLSLYRGALLDGFFVSGAPEFEHWLDRERSRLRLRVSDAAWAMAEASLLAGEASPAERWAKEAVDLTTAEDGEVRRLMRFFQRLGQPAGAIRAYESYAWRLSVETNLEPARETQVLATAIRTEVLETPTAAPYLVSSPLTPSPADPPKKQPAPAGGPETRRPAGRKRLAFVLLLVILLVPFAYRVITRLNDQRRSAGQAPRIIVLPFKNLGPAEDAYLAQGIADEITSRLATIPGITVVAGEVSRRYGDSLQTPREIAEELGVDYVLEGTVTSQHTSSGPGRFRVRPRLIDARSGDQLWSAVLDEDVSDLLTVLASVTLRTADELDVVLDSAQQTRMRKIATGKWAAYDYYLRGYALARGTQTVRNVSAAADLFGKALAIDSSFALAWAWLSYTHTQLFWMHDLAPEHLDTAYTLAEAALHLDPDLPDGHLALGWYYYACCADYKGALVQLERGEASRPGDVDILNLLGNVHKRAGRPTLAISTYRRASNLDPHSTLPLLNLAQEQLWLRRYDQVIETNHQLLALEPREGNAYVFEAWVPLLRDGDVRSAREVMREAAAASDVYQGLRIPFYLDLLDRDYSAALTRLHGPASSVELLDEWLVNDHIRAGLAFRLRGDSNAARAHFDSAVAEIQASLAHYRRSPPFQAWLRSGLAISLAGLGKRTAARDQIQLVLAQDPPAVDAIAGPAALQNLAVADVLLSDRGAALSLLSRLLALPGLLTPAVLRIDPLWDPLRDDPRFQQLVR